MHFSMLVAPFPLMRVLLLFFCFLVPFHAFSQFGSAELTITASSSEESSLLVQRIGNRVFGQPPVLESSRDLSEWEFVSAMTSNGWLLDKDQLASGSLFYRTRFLEEGATWATSVFLPDDGILRNRLFNRFSDYASYVKFTILLDDLSQVYFQDSNLYDFHYEFAVDELDQFQGMDREAYNGVTLQREGQVAVVGAVLIDLYRKEIGIQFEGFDAYSPEQIREWYDLVNASVMKSSLYSGFYMPTESQKESAYAAQDFFESYGIELAGTQRFFEGSACYSQGWNLGRLRYFPYDEIDAAYEAGALLPTDILLTDGIPAELPYVAGIISLQAATPNSHVALLAQSYGIPFVYVENDSVIERLLSLLDEEIFLAVGKDCSAKISSVSESIDDEMRAYLLSLKGNEPIAIWPKEVFGAISADVIGLTPDDIVYFGGKAANFGFLLREIPDNTRPFAVGFSFDLWNAYMDQDIDSRETLGNWIESKLSGYSWPVQDVASLNAVLREIRDKIEDEADFNSTQRSQILDALVDFDPNRKIRFRSSTNVEDGEQFSGAGLYDSKSGCLADELDGDENGSSLCDPTKPKERGVFRALRKVYASFYNSNAYLERLRIGVNEGEIGMAILAHYSYPDEIEMANGVMVYDSYRDYLEIVSQVGAESVTNPLPEGRPEQVVVLSNGHASLHDPSARLRLGEKWVLGEEENYSKLRSYVDSLVAAYRDFHDLPESEYIVLDFEYKLVAPGVLEIKQMRSVPQQEQPTEALAFVGGTSDLSVSVVTSFDSKPVMGLHYLKSELSLSFPSRVYDGDDSVVEPLINQIMWTHVRDGEVVTWTGNPLELPNAGYEDSDGVRTYRWTDEVDGELLSYELWHYIRWRRLSGGGGVIPFRFAADVTAGLNVVFENARLADPSLAEPSYEKQFSARAHLRSPNLFGRNQTARTAPSTGSVNIEMSYVLNSKGQGFMTMSFLKWIQTEIKGLTTEPIILTSNFSQTQVQGHHNWSAAFLFEPRLDPLVSESTKQELEALDVMQIYCSSVFFPVGSEETIPRESIKYIGFDGRVRDEL